MRQITTTPSREIATWMIWMRTSGWWKSCSFLLLPPPNSLAGTPTSERTATRAIWQVPRWRLHQPCIPTAISPPRTPSTLHSCSSCSSSKPRILSRLLPRSLVNLGSQPNNLLSPKPHSIITTLTNSLAPMMSTNTGVDISDRLWLLRSMGRIRTYLPRWIAEYEFDR